MAIIRITAKITEANTKQFPKLQLFDLEVLKKMGKSVKKNNLPLNLLNMAAYNLTPGFAPPPPPSFSFI